MTGHDFAPGKSEYTIVLFQEYTDIKAFERHSQTDCDKRFFKNTWSR